MNRTRPLALAASALFLCTALAPSTATAGGWTQPSGGFYAKVWDRSLIGSKAYLASGEALEVDSFQDHALNLYGEYGLLDQLTLVGFTTPVGWATYGEESTSYVGPSFVGARWGLLQGAVPLAIEAHYGFAPSVGERDLAPLDPTLAYIPTVATQRVDGELQVGYGLPGGWATASVGARYFTADGLDPVLTANAQLGYSSSFGIVAELHAGLARPFGDVEVTNVAGAGQTDYLGLGVGVSYWFNDHVGVSAGVDGVVYARSNAATPALTLGIEVK